MRQGFLLIQVSLVILMVSLGALTFAEQIALDLPGFEWERRFGEDRFQNTPTAIEISPDGVLTIAGSSGLASNFEGNYSLWLWKINQKGEKIHEFEIRNPTQDAKLPQSPYSIRSISTRDNGELFLVVEFSSDHHSLLKINKIGEVVSIKQIPNIDHAKIAKLVLSPNETIYLLGRKFKDGLVMKIGLDGNLIWEKLFKRNRLAGAAEAFDAFPVKEEGTIIIGNAGAFCDFCIGESEVWMVKLDKAGNIQAEYSLQGRNGSIARAGKNGFFVVYDRNDLTRKDQKIMTQEILVQAMDMNLKPLWNTRLMTIPQNVGKFKTIEAAGGGFIVVGEKSNKLSVARFDKKGKEMWSFLDLLPFERTSLNYYMASRNNQFFILYSAFKINEKRQRNEKVGLIKFVQQ